MTASSNGFGTGVVARLLADAHQYAAAGKRTEALVLLRWASRVADPREIPHVLLAYHHVRGSRDDIAPRTANAVRSDIAAHNGSLPPGVDALGFPRPRFPTGVPDLDPGAFIPSVVQQASRPEVRSAPRSRSTAPVPTRALHPAAAAAGAAILIMIVGLFGSGILAVPRTLSPDHAVSGAAAALEEGDAPRAIRIARRVREPPPGLQLIRGRALLVLGDTARAISALQSAAAHPAASTEDVLSAARVLAVMKGQEQVAADVYLLAFSRGLPVEHWEVVEAALRRAGRHGEADRLARMHSWSPPNEVPARPGAP